MNMDINTFKTACIKHAIAGKKARDNAKKIANGKALLHDWLKGKPNRILTEEERIIAQEWTGASIAKHTTTFDLYNY